MRESKYHVDLTRIEDYDDAFDNGTSPPSHLPRTTPDFFEVWEDYEEPGASSLDEIECYLAGSCVTPPVVPHSNTPVATKIHFSRATYGGVNWIFLTLLIPDRGGLTADRWEDDNQMMATPPVIPQTEDS